MRRTASTIFVLMMIWNASYCSAQATIHEDSKMSTETKAQRNRRMSWWREARFGLFIHWGLYAVPAGQWQDNDDHGEWIMHSGRIPLDAYETFREKFNPTRFDAEAWVRMAQQAGMKYVVITTKHHDGFCLFDSQHTDYDIMATPFQRDIMKEMSAACQKAGLRMCWYHSIMDWHHADYLPRREWEPRSADGADFDRYLAYLKNQVRELLTNYGPIGIMWFDGEWEGTWTHEHGRDLCRHVRSLQPDVIVNNRVDKGRRGMQGMTTSDEFEGDYGTPEQEIPPRGLTGVDWETCMTMNRHWGYNRQDTDWKSTADLIRMLADTASKGGNFLLNVGPTAEGLFPQPCVERLREIGAWMRVNGEAIHGTTASPFRELTWGRCTCKTTENGNTRLYLHVFDWPNDRRLVVSGLSNEGRQAFLLADPGRSPLKIVRKEDALVVHLPAQPPDTINSVAVVDIVGHPDVVDPPIIDAPTDMFVDSLAVSVTTDRSDVDVRYTEDNNPPTVQSPRADGSIRLHKSATITARGFRNGQPVSGCSRATFRKVAPRPPVDVAEPVEGLLYEYFEGVWDRLPDFDALTPMKSGTIADFEFSPRTSIYRFAFRYHGLLRIPRDGVYTFHTVSDDGSRLYIGDELVVDNDGLHEVQEAAGSVALATGLHPITVTYFERTGAVALEVYYTGPETEKQRIPPSALFHPGGQKAKSGV